MTEACKLENALIDALSCNKGCGATCYAFGTSYSHVVWTF